MSIANGQVETPAGAVTCVVDHTPGVPLFVMAHGAGGSVTDRATASAARTLGSAGVGTLRFNFPYRERKSGRPDPMPVLTDTFAAVVEAARQELAPGAVIIGGRSMGGRAASMLAAEGFGADGLLLLAYPLHPPGQLTKLRDAHIPAIRVPVLCFNGTRDTFCDRALMERAVATATTDWIMHWLEGADHSFHVRKSSGRTDADVMAEVRDATAAWLRAHGFVS